MKVYLTEESEHANGNPWELRNWLRYGVVIITSGGKQVLIPWDKVAYILEPHVNMWNT
jgi:hypothetical protein